MKKEKINNTEKEHLPSCKKLLFVGEATLAGEVFVATGIGLRSSLGKTPGACV